MRSSPTAVARHVITDDDSDGITIAPEPATGDSSGSSRQDRATARSIVSARAHRRRGQDTAAWHKVHRYFGRTRVGGTNRIKNVSSSIDLT